MRGVLYTVQLCVLGSVLCGCAAPGGQAEGSVARDIWALEHRYWGSNREADYEGIVSTWDDRFLGWPDREENPIDKEEGARYARREFTKPGSYTFRIEPLGVRVRGDMVLNFYRVVITPKDPGGGGQPYSLRIVHTWVNDGGRWRILGGMSNRK